MAYFLTAVLTSKEKTINIPRSNQVLISPSPGHCKLLLCEISCPTLDQSVDRRINYSTVI